MELTARPGPTLAEHDAALGLTRAPEMELERQRSIAREGPDYSI